MAFLATFAFSAVIDIAGLGAARFDRRVAGWRSFNPGSVGLPFHAGAPGTAYWATLAPDVTLRRTTYPVADSLTRGHAAGDPSAETIARMPSNTTNTPLALDPEADKVRYQKISAEAALGRISEEIRDYTRAGCGGTRRHPPVPLPREGLSDSPSSTRRPAAQSMLVWPRPTRTGC